MGVDQAAAAAVPCSSAQQQAGRRAGGMHQAALARAGYSPCGVGDPGAALAAQSPHRHLVQARVLLARQAALALPPAAHVWGWQAAVSTQ